MERLSQESSRQEEPVNITIGSLQEAKPEDGKTLEPGNIVANLGLEVPEKKQKEQVKEGEIEAKGFQPTQEKPEIIETVENVGHRRTEQEIESYKNIREGINEQQGPEGKKEAQNKDRALEILSDPKIMERSPREIVDAFRNATEDDFGHHRHLARERNEMIESNLKDRHMVVIRGKEASEKYKKEIIKEEQKRISSERHSTAINTLREMHHNIKPELFTQILFQIKKKLGLEGIDGSIALDKLINDGYDVEKVKKRWFSDKIDIPKRGSGLVTTGSSNDFLYNAVQQSRVETFGEAQVRADLRIIEGRKMFLAEKIACTKIIIDQTVEKYNSDKQAGENAKQGVGVEGKPGILGVEKPEGSENKSEKKIISKKDIEEASSFDELYKILEKGGKIMGSGGKEHDAEELRGVIEKNVDGVQKLIDKAKTPKSKKSLKIFISDENNALFKKITRGSGLRGKMVELFLKMADSERPEEHQVKKQRPKRKN